MNQGKSDICVKTILESVQIRYCRYKEECEHNDPVDMTGLFAAGNVRFRLRAILLRPVEFNWN